MAGTPPVGAVVVVAGAGAVDVEGAAVTEDMIGGNGCGGGGEKSVGKREESDADRRECREAGLYR